MKRMMLLAAATVLSWNAVATDTPAPAPAAPAAGKTSAPSDDADEATISGCVRDTGSRIKSNDCRPGQVIRSKEITLDGATDVGQVLRQSSTSVLTH